ncbi:hypothetical protein AOQ84DRAFT_410848 [Glonium stellatum]|uniref:Uncharacterized protein n=1 Tax=Glonium stellatum TaxID=574774 RepID=A0A8E2EX67_9PEZI|nr:hypothetical protein AOQ84DRAFT_410848 [Glonium stellatum]
MEVLIAMRAMTSIIATIAQCGSYFPPSRHKLLEYGAERMVEVRLKATVKNKVTKTRGNKTKLVKTRATKTKVASIRAVKIKVVNPQGGQNKGGAQSRGSVQSSAGDRSTYHSYLFRSQAPSRTRSIYQSYQSYKFYYTTATASAGSGGTTVSVAVLQAANIAGGKASNTAGVPSSSASGSQGTDQISSQTASDLFGLEWRGSKVKSTPSTKKTIWL